MRSQTALTAASLLVMGMFASACTTANAPAGEPAPPSRAERTKEEGIALAKQHATAAELYQALRDQAQGGRPLTWTSLPDWRGVYTRAPVAGFAFDPDTPEGGAPTARLTPEYEARMRRRIEDVKNGIEWDPISTCAPPGHPRWLTEPFLREFIVTPEQTWLINEMVNDIRRVYTDGRDHIPPADRYPLYNGDSIGFWDGDRLVIHTNQLRSGIYQRAHPDYTDQVETVEVWYKADPKTLRADVWVYDPPALAEPWFTRQSYLKLDDEDKMLRIRYCNFAENLNNSVFQTQDGSTQFQDLTFTPNDDTRGGKP
jgi:hypothetical protein